MTTKRIIPDKALTMGKQIYLEGVKAGIEAYAIRNPVTGHYTVGSGTITLEQALTHAQITPGISNFKIEELLRKGLKG